MASLTDIECKVLALVVESEQPLFDRDQQECACQLDARGLVHGAATMNGPWWTLTENGRNRILADLLDTVVELRKRVAELEARPNA